MRYLVIVALASILCVGCAMFDIVPADGYCMRVTFTHDAGTVDGLVCAGETVKQVCEKIEADTGLDIWKVATGVTCKVKECKEPVNPSDDEIKGFLKQ